MILNEFKNHEIYLVLTKWLIVSSKWYLSGELVANKRECVFLFEILFIWMKHKMSPINHTLLTIQSVCLVTYKKLFNESKFKEVLIWQTLIDVYLSTTVHLMIKRFFISFS